MNKRINPAPCNDKASNEVKAVLRYLSELSGKGMITGQHTQTTVQKELRYIEEVTGKLLPYAASSFSRIPLTSTTAMPVKLV